MEDCKCADIFCDLQEPQQPYGVADYWEESPRLSVGRKLCYLFSRMTETYKQDWCVWKWEHLLFFLLTLTKG